MSVAQSILDEHEVTQADTEPHEVAIRADQVYTHDNVGSMVYLQYEALDVDKLAVDELITYFDHNALKFYEEQSQNHAFLKSAAQKYGSRLSKVGNGICHQVHREQFAKPGEVIFASDSHTPTLGGLGTLGVGAGGMDVAATMAGHPIFLEDPDIVNVRLTGSLPPGSTAKDVILTVIEEMTVKGGYGKVFEFTGPGVESLSVPERCTICNMTAELGATSGVFPSDEVTKEYLEKHGRGNDWRDVSPDDAATYDDLIEVDLSVVEPLVAKPSMPDNLVPVGAVDDIEVDQVLIGSCTNGSYADIASIAPLFEERRVHPDVEFVIYPGSRRVTQSLAETGVLSTLVAAGVSVSESTCGACVGKGHIPAPGEVSLRAFNRNYSGRSGLDDDRVYLASPLVAAATAIEGRITDPRELLNGSDLDPAPEPERYAERGAGLAEHEPNPNVELVKGSNIGEVPIKEPPTERVELPVGIKVGDDVTTDHIAPSKADHYRDNIPKLSEYVLTTIDEDYPGRATTAGRSAIVGAKNYGQGSSREHAAMVTQYLGVETVLAKSFSRIHKNNLVNFGVVPLEFVDPDDYDAIEEGDALVIDDFASAVERESVTVRNETDGTTIETELIANDRQRAYLVDGGKLPYIRNRIEN
jgi:aconitate hydratase